MKWQLNERQTDRHTDTHIKGLTNGGCRRKYIRADFGGFILL